MFHMVNVSLQSEISKYSDEYTLVPESTTVINMLTAVKCLVNAFFGSGRLSICQMMLAALMGYGSRL